jgi:5-methylcytosine-specific restriction endonuclease McrA
MSYISAALRKQVTDRAESKCEYCKFPQALSFFTFEMEHIISEKHDGETNLDNLALACPPCNRAKGSDLGSIQSLKNSLHSFILVFSNGLITFDLRVSRSLHSRQKDE